MSSARLRGKDFAISAVKLATGLVAGRGIKVEDVEVLAANEQLINLLCGKAVQRSAAKIRLFLTKAQAGPLKQAAFHERLRILRKEFDEALRSELDVPRHATDEMWEQLAGDVESWSPDPVDQWHRQLTEQPDTLPVLVDGNPIKALANRGDRGTVLLDLVIDSFGAIRHKDVIESEAGYKFTHDVLEAIDQCTFAPARKGDDVVWVRITMPITFNAPV